jgi:hypothetical protein
LGAKQRGRHTFMRHINSQEKELFLTSTDLHDKGSELKNEMK